MDNELEVNMVSNVALRWWWHGPRLYSVQRVRRTGYACGNVVLEIGTAGSKRWPGKTDNSSESYKDDFRNSMRG